MRDSIECGLPNRPYRGRIRRRDLRNPRVASAIVDITPTTPMRLAGYSARTAVSSRVADRLEANLLQFGDDRGESLTLISLDTLFVESNFVEALATRVGVSSSSIVIVASHTHNAPSLSRTTPDLGPCHTEYEEFVLAKLAAAHLSLVAERAGRAAEISFTESVGNYCVNRRKPAYTIDYGALRNFQIPRLRYGIALAANELGFADNAIKIFSIFVDKRPTAVIWSLPAHPAFYPDRLSVAPDFPGTVRKLLRERWGDQLAVLFLPGFAGSAIPRMSSRRPATLKEAILRLLPGRRTLNDFSKETYRAYCNSVARDIINSVESLDRRELIGRIFACNLTSASIFETDSGGSVEMELHLIRLGASFSILLSSGEIVGEWAQFLRYPDGTILSGYAAGRPLYVPTVSQIAEGGYESVGFKRPFGLSGEFHPDLENTVISAFSELMMENNGSSW